ncbi:MAG: hypothetical protein EXR47_02470 [Dehalococcoidia bacterium]|nr:hypothetical protein [Dehalococcoidia bacterium]
MTHFPRQSVFVDQDVVGQILGVIDGAKQYVVIVSPYLDMWQHAQNAIGRAVKRGVDVRMFLRNDRDKPPLDQIRWLFSNKVKVFAVQRLHAKIYMNEQTVLISSMNFTESSAMNSLEIAYLVGDPEHAKRVREYVKGNITSSAVQVPTTSEIPPSVEQANPIGRAPVNVAVGFCIRCKRNLYFEPTKPLCDDCYDSWARYGNEDYPEVVCHSCGQPATVTKARPLCAPCYSQLR